MPSPKHSVGTAPHPQLDITLAAPKTAIPTASMLSELKVIKKHKSTKELLSLIRLKIIASIISVSLHPLAALRYAYADFLLAWGVAPRTGFTAGTGIRFFFIFFFKNSFQHPFSKTHVGSPSCLLMASLLGDLAARGLPEPPEIIPAGLSEETGCSHHRPP